MNENNKSIAELEAELLNYDGADKIVASTELHSRLNAISNIEIKYLSHIHTLDELTEGFQSGEVVTMSGRTKCGKTSFCQTLTYNYAVQGISCLWFTYEIPVRYFLAKFPSLPLFYLPETLTDTSLDWIEKRIVEAKLKYDTKVVFVDHLHYLIPMSQQANVSILIGGVMRELKKMSIRHDVVIFIIAHTGKVNGEAKPSLDSIRDSSFVAQESDFVLMISRPDIDEDNQEANNDNKSKLRVLANRRTGRRGCIDMIYQDNMFKEVQRIGGNNA